MVFTECQGYNIFTSLTRALETQESLLSEEAALGCFTRKVSLSLLVLYVFRRTEGDYQPWQRFVSPLPSTLFVSERWTPISPQYRREGEHQILSILTTENEGSRPVL